MCLRSCCALQWSDYAWAHFGKGRHTCSVSHTMWAPTGCRRRLHKGQKTRGPSLRGLASIPVHAHSSHKSTEDMGGVGDRRLGNWWKTTPKPRCVGNSVKAAIHLPLPCWLWICREPWSFQWNSSRHLPAQTHSALIRTKESVCLEFSPEPSPKPNLSIPMRTSPPSGAEDENPLFHLPVPQRPYPLKTTLQKELFLLYCLFISFQPLISYSVIIAKKCSQKTC